MTENNKIESGRSVNRVLDIAAGVLYGTLVAGLVSNVGGPLAADLYSKIPHTSTQGSHEMRGTLVSKDLRTRLGVDKYYATMETSNGERKVVVYFSGVVGSKTPERLYHLLKEGDRLVLQVQNFDTPEPNELIGITAKLDR